MYVFSPTHTRRPMEKFAHVCFNFVTLKVIAEFSLLRKCSVKIRSIFIQLSV